MDKSPACRQEGETKQECVSRKIPEIKEEHPEWDDDQVQAVAYSICDKACSDKSNEEKTMAMSRRGQQFIQKHFGIPIEKGFENQNDGTIMVNGFFTSDKIDEVGDIITKEATENAIPKYRQWGNIRYMHLPKPVAKVVSIGKEDGLEWNEVQIQVVDSDAVFQVKNGLLKALSVGIIIRSWEDIDIDEETGGWIINNYDLAEISLVDHPANYDARLFLDEDKVVPVGMEIRQLVAEHGFAMVSKALGTIITPSVEEEINMAALKKDLETEEVTEELEEEVEASIDEEEETEEELEASIDEEEEIEEEVEAFIDEDSEEEVEEVLEDMDVRLTEEDPENDPDSILFDSEEPDEEKDVEDEEEFVSDNSEEETIEDGVTGELAISPDLVNDLARAIVAVLSETEAEASVEEQPEVERSEEIDSEEDEVALLRAEVAELRALLNQLLESPAPRKGLVRGTSLPHEDVEHIQEEGEEAEHGDVFSGALRRYLQSPARVVIRERQ